VLGKYCLPDSEALKNETFKDFENLFYQYFDGGEFTNYVSDVYNVWYVELICVGIAFVLGFVYLVFLRCCASLIVFVALVGIMIALGGFGAWLYLYKSNY
jgi:hypothetical protein